MTTREATPLNRTRWAAIGAAIAITLGGGSLIGVSASGTESTFVPVEPGRILDTRSTTPIGADNAYGTPLRLKVAGADLTDGSRSAGIPTTATAVSGTITATATGGWGFVTAYPCDSTNDTPPAASNVNYTGANQTVANSATIPLSTDGYICLTAYDTTHLLFDVSGYYTPANTTVDAYTKTETDALLANKADAASVSDQQAPQLSGSGLTETALISRDFTSVFSYPQVQLTSEGNPVIALVVQADGYVSGFSTDVAVRLIFCSDVTCQGDRTEVDVTDTGAAIQNLRLTDEDLPLLTYVTADGQYYTRCTDPTCSDGVMTPIRLSTGNEPVALDIDPEGRPGLAWVDLSGDFQFVKCSSLDCSSRTQNVVATSAEYTSSASRSFRFSPDGSPVFAYTTGGDNDKLRLVTCNDAACAGADETDVLIDDSTNTESGVDFDFTSAGKPIIGYVNWDFARDEARLSIAACADTTCTSWSGTDNAWPGSGPQVNVDANDRAHVSFLTSSRVLSDVDFAGQFSSSSVTRRVGVMRCLTPACTELSFDEFPTRTLDIETVVDSTVAPDGTVFVTSVDKSLVPMLRISAY